MDEFTAALNKFNAKLKYYVVVPVTKCLSEDGKYTEGDSAGYGIENTMTGVVEHTTICLPAAMFQATHFDEMLTSLLEGTPELSVVESGAGTPDILPH